MRGQERFLVPPETYLGTQKTYLGTQKAYLGTQKAYLGTQKTYLGTQKTYLGPQKTGFPAALCWYIKNIGASRLFGKNLEGHRPSKPPTNASCAAPLTLSKPAEAHLQ
jgi:hypothetical protein